MPWPLSSPDMNIIEHVWDQLDALVCAHNPLLMNKEQLWEVLEEEWENFLRKALDTLYESMLCRLAALLKAQLYQVLIESWSSVSDSGLASLQTCLSLPVTGCEKKNHTPLILILGVSLSIQALLLVSEGHCCAWQYESLPLDACLFVCLLATDLLFQKFCCSLRTFGSLLAAS